MPHIHLLLGIASVNIFYSWGVNSSSLLWFILGSVVPDIDYFLNLLIRKNSHRQLLTHYPLLYLVAAIFLGFWGSITFVWFCFGALVHLSIDIIDWKMYLLAPFSNRSVSFLNLDYTKGKSFFSNLQFYYKNRNIVILEIISLFIFGLTFFI